MQIFVFFCAFVTWAHASHHATNCADGRRAIVHLFEWKWNDIATECETFLGPKGYCGVQVSPPNENVVIGVEEGATEPPRPWWERYQPVSYNLETRSGSHDQFVDMVRRCNNVGVRIYVDAIINHMSGMGRSGYGTGGTFFDADAGDFPGVPYEMSNFNDCSDCPQCCCINAWTDTTAVRNCRLVGLIDLKQSLTDTHDKIVGFLNKLIDIGVAGFRVDAAKHMWPEDMESIFNSCNELNTEFFPSGSRPFVYLEVIDYNQQGEVNVHEYTHIGRVTEFRFCTKVGQCASALWQIPGIYDPGWGMCAPEDAFTFVDNHDNQRGHGGGDASVTHKDPHRYKIAQAISLGYDYGWPRVMSSYDFGDDTDTGPPHDADYNTEDVVIGSDGQCANGWICEHRWTAIAGMAGFAKATNGMTFDNWVNDGNKAAWSRGGKGFIAISNEGEWSGTFQTNMPAGEYCNVIKGCATSSGCVGDTITVGGDGSVSITVPSGDEPMIAIHVEAMAGSNQCVNGAGPPDGTTSGPGMTTVPGGEETTTTATTTTTTESTTTESTTSSSSGTTATTESTTTGTTTTTELPEGDWQTTIVYIFHQTAFGQDMFVRGGLGSGSGRTCTPDVTNDACAVNIIHAEQSGSHFEKYSAWAEGDTHLDWYGAEPGQGNYQGQSSFGTPMFWTTNQESNPGYQPDNEWGDHWWKVEFQMNCDETEKGWFELKGYGSGAGWESDINQPVCGGAGGQGSSPPYTSGNHFARCGYRNIFAFNSNDCTIEIIN